MLSNVKKLRNVTFFTLEPSFNGFVLESYFGSPVLVATEELELRSSYIHKSLGNKASQVWRIQGTQIHYLLTLIANLADQF